MTEESKIQAASQGHGPLWQRDYYAQTATCASTPEALISMIRADFPAFSPAELAAFSNEKSTPLAVGDEMKVFIQGYGECGVRVVHINARSLTLRTLQGHFEAGRITFGAYYQNGKLCFRIRSRARSTDRLRHVGYQLIGKKLQKQTWRIFIERVVEKSGCEMIGRVQTRTRTARSTLADLGELDVPTFIARDKVAALETPSFETPSFETPTAAV